MTLTDQADFVISDTDIHRRLLAWKLSAKSAESRTTTRVFSIRDFNGFHKLTGCAANRPSVPTKLDNNPKPIQFDRSTFGGLKPVANGPTRSG